MGYEGNISICQCLTSLQHLATIWQQVEQH